MPDEYFAPPRDPSPPPPRSRARAVLDGFAAKPGRIVASVVIVGVMVGSVRLAQITQLGIFALFAIVIGVAAVNRVVGRTRPQRSTLLDREALLMARFRGRSTRIELPDWTLPDPSAPGARPVPHASDLGSIPLELPPGHRGASSS